MKTSVFLIIWMLSLGCGSSSTPAQPMNDAGPDAAAAGGPCSFGLGGDRVVASTKPVDACGHDVIGQQLGQGDFTLTLGGGIATTNGSISVACTLSSPNAPAVGATWSLTTPSGGNCEVDEVAGSTATIWSSSTTSADGTATVTFKSVTLTASTLNPKNVYYVYDATLDAKLKGRTAGATDITVSGDFSSDKLPLGI